MDKPEFTETLEKMKAYCAYQERCESEILNKLNSSFLNQSEKEKLIIQLKNQNFLDNKRFAEAYASGKFKIKGWGKQKIRVGLKAKQIPESLIDSAFEELDQKEYKTRLIQIAQKKWRLLSYKKDNNTRQKLFRFLYGKGYESELINTILVELIHG
jgi:regulatory protein